MGIYEELKARGLIAQVTGCNYSPAKTMRKRHRPVLTFSHILPACSFHYSTVRAKVGKTLQEILFSI